MEAGGKECEEETLQTAFKKLRVDAESLCGAVSASEAVASRSASRSVPDTNGAKPKLVCQKDNWHGCTRKTSRGASRTQRRRRSKSPILQPPKFTYCSASPPATLAPPAGCMKQHTLASPAGCVKQHTLVPPAGCSTLHESCASGTSSSVTQTEPSDPQSSSLIFGSSAASASSSQDTLPSVKATGVQVGEESKEGAASDFRALSEQSRAACSCLLSQEKSSEESSASEPQCYCQKSDHSSWNHVEVYSFSGLRNVVTECERSSLGPEAQRTVTVSSGSARSCSEQARAYVDDITIEDLSGYLEYYLYIPKKMSHMAEMMYT
ncbi:unnamed protein product [Knipowitschia caucasica]